MTPYPAGRDGPAGPFTWEMDMATQLVPENLNVAGARLPAAYEKACAALTSCASIDECQTWANKAAALASYARQADDDTMQKQAMRIQSRAVRRCGELLKEIDGRGGDRSEAANDGGSPTSPRESRSGGAPTFAPTRRAAAEQAGMSRDQQVTAVRVANVPVAHFEAAVESEEPPTVTRLADMGRRSTAKQDAPVPPGFQAQIELMSHARGLAEFAGRYSPEFVGPAVTDYNCRELRGYIAKCRRFLTAIAPLIKETTDGL